ncbi:hypothetical protein G9F71_023705 [Clostridium sp. FP2]|uniref:hypothetical protein n=1 Tax=Clostridium sp. FP2 TaxID=2724481 RepID=UPI0013E99607|nr:hypothetical protein [Clostridium sp. FP2]MBZ9625814.1 hypothetical protein [Clostridium sp. FP2]
MSFIKPGHNYSMELKSRMFYDFRNFGTELENSNEQISQILKINNYNKDKQLINREIVVDFSRSNSSAQHISNGKYYDDYWIMYLNVSETIKNILSDGLISPPEKKYLESLYSYNDELIKECKSILGNTYKDIDIDFDNKKKLEKNIIKIYNNYSKKSEELLNTEKYSFIKEYKGDFSGKNFNKLDFENAKKYCKETFLKIVKNTPLEEENSTEGNSDTYIFKTKSLPIDSIMEDGVEYKINFHKKTKEVSIDATRFTVPNYGLTEKQLDKIAREMVLKFSNNAFRYDKKINYEKNTKIRSIEYSYIEEINGIYDEMKKIEICLERQGLISKFKIVYPYDKKIIAPTISKEEILKKIEKGSEVIDVLTIRNTEGKTEYEVHLKQNNTVYATVFDGQKGDLKYYGKDIRNYKIK